MSVASHVATEDITFGLLYGNHDCLKQGPTYVKDLTMKSLKLLE